MKISFRTWLALPLVLLTSTHVLGSDAYVPNGPVLGDFGTLAEMPPVVVLSYLAGCVGFPMNFDSCLLRTFVGMAFSSPSFGYQCEPPSLSVQSVYQYLSLASNHCLSKGEGVETIEIDIAAGKILTIFSQTECWASLCNQDNIHLRLESQWIQTCSNVELPYPPPLLGETFIITPESIDEDSILTCMLDYVMETPASEFGLNDPPVPSVYQCYPPGYYNISGVCQDSLGRKVLDHCIDILEPVDDDLPMSYQYVPNKTHLKPVMVDDKESLYIDDFCAILEELSSTQGRSCLATICSTGSTPSPSIVPTLSPSVSPSELPTNSPSVSPSELPTYTLSSSPSATPTYGPSISTSEVPTYSPSLSPSKLTIIPSFQSAAPTRITSAVPSVITAPSSTPSTFPSWFAPISAPNTVVTSIPSNHSLPPTAQPTATPTPKPSTSPTAKPVATPTAMPTATPTRKPTANPTPSPTVTPTAKPTDDLPTSKPTANPTPNPTALPTAKPTATPTSKPTSNPTPNPTVTPTAKPTATPTLKPTANPTTKPTAVPTPKPTANPTAKPTATPTPKPTAKPTATPTGNPTAKPTATPTGKPTAMPLSVTLPSVSPSHLDSFNPSSVPSEVAFQRPSAAPSSQPIPKVPTKAPSKHPQFVASTAPSGFPSAHPTFGTVQAIVTVDLVSTMILNISLSEVPLSGDEFDEFQQAIERAVVDSVATVAGSADSNCLSLDGIATTNRRMRRLDDASPTLEVEFSVLARRDCVDSTCNEIPSILVAEYSDALDAAVASGRMTRAIQEEAASRNVESLLSAVVVLDSYRLDRFTSNVSAPQGEVAATSTASSQRVVPVLTIVITGLMMMLVFAL